LHTFTLDSLTNEQRAKITGDYFKEKAREAYEIGKDTAVRLYEDIRGLLSSQ
jgi:hypothetical protein